MMVELGFITQVMNTLELFLITGTYLDNRESGKSEQFPVAYELPG